MTPTPQAAADEGALFDSFGRDPHSWNIHGDEDVDPDALDDGTGRPGIAMVAGALAVWCGLQRGEPTVAEAARAFNLPAAMIREAIPETYWMFLQPEEGASDDETTIGCDGE